MMSKKNNIYKVYYLILTLIFNNNGKFYFKKRKIIIYLRILHPPKIKKKHILFLHLFYECTTTENLIQII